MTMTDKTDQARTAASFRARHAQRPVLLLPNAWDAISARIFADRGFAWLATTSGGVAWALGYRDGEAAPWREVVDATARIVRAARVPVSADIEAGYAATPAEVAAHVAEIIGAGVVGINLEDGLHGPARIRAVDDAARRIGAARAAAAAEGVPIVINARCDVFHLQFGDAAARLGETIARCKAYLAAGADCVYPFGLRDPDTIAALTSAVPAPVNITGRAGMPDAAALERLGVARITIASAPTLVAMAAIRALADSLYATGAFDGLAAPLRHPDAQNLFAPPTE
ncbi:MAG TPA: isocitrate lyase/phosphoenolpyruvate mutase family protein [Stellaceae bacterium]|nr:isocitrate lyase/phosphoenolpyruvate mutase family protein [Stellaceae bacterium]